MSDLAFLDTDFLTAVLFLSVGGSHLPKKDRLI